MRTIHEFFAKQGLVRSSRHRILGGVCGGLADKWGLDPWALRAIVVLTMLLLPGSQLLVYPLFWVLMPDDTFAVPGRPADPMVTIHPDRPGPRG